MPEKLTPSNVASLLQDEESINFFLNDAFESGDAACVAHAIGMVARAKGMTKITGETGLSREALYRSFSEDGNPSLKSTLAVLQSLGFGLAAKPQTDNPADAAE
jgi:probable addiction module antidote protein